MSLRVLGSKGYCVICFWPGNKLKIFSFGLGRGSPKAILFQDFVPAFALNYSITSITS
uniref:Uncharacterized protein n=1 Tax=Anguilla anguilla TaxID=7936 RepID=A0A0E9TUJ6_ANGAN